MDVEKKSEPRTWAKLSQEQLDIYKNLYDDSSTLRLTGDEFGDTVRVGEYLESLQDLLSSSNQKRKLFERNEW